MGREAEAVTNSQDALQEEMPTAKPRRGRPPGPTAQSALTRAQLMEAAVDLFASQGFHGTAMSDIAERTGIQRGAIYYYVDSKEALLWEVVRSYFEAELAWMADVNKASLDSEEKLRTMIRHHVRTIVDHRRQVAINIRDGGSLLGEHAKQRRQLRHQVQAAWQRAIDDAHAAGSISTADEVVVNGMLGMLNTIYLWYRPDGGRGTDEIADALADTLLNGLLIRPKK